MPTVLANALLSFVPDRTVPVRGPDRVGVVSPMFDEEAGAAAALGSLLDQSEPFDELAVSVNGGTDRTLEVVRRTLAERGFARVYAAPAPGLAAHLERWHAEAGPAVVVLDHAAPISKSDSINAVLAGGFLACERVLVVDGDTVFDPGFLANLKDDFYRLRVQRRRGARRYVIEDVALQSGAVTSLPPGPGAPMAGLISRARSGEYAVAALLRTGQTARLGRGRVFGASRLYTVVGCGFAARRDCFPMPSDTLTEDHDFTLAVQNEPVSERRVTVAELAERGFRVKLGGAEIDAAEFFDPQDEVVLRRTSDARFVAGALMRTEDPANLAGYLRQVERWNGGGVENALKRLAPSGPRGLRPNVAFAVAAAQFENLFGLALLLLALPVALGVNFALPGYGTALTGLAAWLGLDLLVTLLLVAAGSLRLWRAQGLAGGRLLGRALGATARATLPLLVLRPLGAVAYVAGAARALADLPRRRRRARLDAKVTITWERPRAVRGRQVSIHTTTVALSMLLVNVALFAVAAYLGEATRPGYKTTWRLIHTAQPVRAEDHVALPLPLAITPLAELLEPGAQAGAAHGGDREAAAWAPVTSDEPLAEAEPDGATLQLVLALPDQPGEEGLSAYCSVGFTARSAPTRRLLGAGAAAYRPLSYWERLVLARLAPLAAHHEEAATAYDVPAELLLRVLVNESYLDPLAVGPTQDLGLAQVTDDALTLLRALSDDPLSPFANPRFFDGPFNVFDPDFSLCAGAAKLAWARSQPGGEDERFAYARYINPLEGVQRNALNPVHAELVVALEELRPLADALTAVFAAYREEPQRLTDQERALLDVYRAVGEGQLSLSAAYLTVGELVERFGIDDAALYDAVRERLYGLGETTASL